MGVNVTQLPWTISVSMGPKGKQKIPHGTLSGSTSSWATGRPGLSSENLSLEVDGQKIIAKYRAEVVANTERYWILWGKLKEGFQHRVGA